MQASCHTANPAPKVSAARRRQRPRRTTSHLGRDSRNSVLVARRTADDQEDVGELCTDGNKRPAADTATAAAARASDEQIDAAVAATAAAFSGDLEQGERGPLLLDFVQTDFCYSVIMLIWTMTMTCIPTQAETCCRKTWIMIFSISFSVSTFCFSACYVRPCRVFDELSLRVLARIESTV